MGGTCPKPQLAEPRHPSTYSWSRARTHTAPVTVGGLHNVSLETHAWAGGSFDHAGFHGALFHSDNLQVCKIDTANINLSAVNDPLLKCFTIKSARGLVHSLTSHSTLTYEVTNNSLHGPSRHRCAFRGGLTCSRTHLFIPCTGLALNGEFTRVSPMHRLLSAILRPSGLGLFTRTPNSSRVCGFYLQATYGIRHLNEEAI